MQDAPDWTPSPGDLANAGLAAIKAEPGDALKAAIVAVLPAPLRVVSDALDWHAGRATRTIIQMLDEATQEWAAEAHRLLPLVIAGLQATEPRIERLEEQLIERSEDREFRRLLANFAIEASRESIDERRRMLTYATVGAFNVTMTIAEAARAERTLRELDPEDIDQLRSPYSLTQPRRAMPPPLPPPHSDVLVAAGCLRYETGANTRGAVGFRVTRVGRLVLTLLKSYEIHRT